ncbi:MAG: hypothetical protein HQL91_07115, partial [Magnetococcales bacterium]|nr:hypothetical protein [Magnetococcales bacterium]
MTGISASTSRSALGAQGANATWPVNPSARRSMRVRALGIPTLHDRGKQALHLLAVEPLAEGSADPNSYGFRPYRSTKDASGSLFTGLAQRRSPQWVLEGDIKGCFDNISHEWLVNNVIMDKKVLTHWLPGLPLTDLSPQGSVPI